MVSSAVMTVGVVQFACADDSSENLATGCRLIRRAATDEFRDRRPEIYEALATADGGDRT